MIWVVQTENDLYGFAPLNLDYYTSHVKHLIRVGAEFNYCAGNQLLPEALSPKSPNNSPATLPEVIQ